MTSIMVTGGSGFVGSHTCRMLAERDDYVVDYDIAPPLAERAFILEPVKDKIRFEQGSVEDLSQILLTIKKHGVKKVVHAASIVNPPLLNQNPMLAYRVNLGGAMNILEAARVMDLERIVYMSSIGVFVSKKYEPIDENHPVLRSDEGPYATAYGAAKIGGEAFCWSYHFAHGVDFVALRPSAIYGVGMFNPIFIKPIVENSVKGLPTRIAKGRDFPRDYTYVRDVAQAIVLSLYVPSAKLKDRVFLVATGRRLTTPGELIHIVGDVIPTADIEVGPGLEEWDKREILTRGLMNIERARQQLGYEPKYDIRSGVKDYVGTYREYLTKQPDI